MMRSNTTQSSIVTEESKQAPGNLKHTIHNKNYSLFRTLRRFVIVVTNGNAFCDFESRVVLKVAKNSSVGSQLI